MSLCVLRRETQRCVTHPVYTVLHGKTWACLVAQMVKNLPATRENWVRALGWEDPLEEGMKTHSSILALEWRIRMDRGAWWATVHGVTKSDTPE